MCPSDSTVSPADLLLANKYEQATRKEHIAILTDIMRLPEPRISVLGGSRITTHAWCAQQAHAFAKKCAHGGASIITGGGPGIMEAAARGALEGNPDRQAIGISAFGLKPAQKNDTLQRLVEVTSLEVRQWLLLNFSQALVFFPGGFGTLFELAQAFTLMDIEKMAPVPVILVCTDHWTPLGTWLAASAQENLINPELLTHAHIVDSADEACALVHNLMTKK